MLPRKRRKRKRGGGGRWIHVDPRSGPSLLQGPRHIQRGRHAPANVAGFWGTCLRLGGIKGERIGQRCEWQEAGGGVSRHQGGKCPAGGNDHGCGHAVGVGESDDQRGGKAMFVCNLPNNVSEDDVLKLSRALGKCANIRTKVVVTCDGANQGVP